MRLPLTPLTLRINKAPTAAIRLRRARAPQLGRARAIATQSTTETEGHSRQEKCGCGCPGEAHEVFADMCFLAGGAESVAAFDDPCTVGVLVWMNMNRVGKIVRHERRSKRLEEQRNKRRQARDIPSQPTNQRQQPRQKRNRPKNQRNQPKRKHKPAQVEVHMRPNKLLGNILGRAKVARRIKCQRRHALATIVIVPVIPRAADGEEGPARRVARVGDVGGGRFEEVEAV